MLMHLECTDLGYNPNKFRPVHLTCLPIPHSRGGVGRLVHVCALAYHCLLPTGVAQKYLMALL